MMEAENTLTRPRTWRRWFAFLGGGVAWTFHLISIYAIGEFGCVGGWGRITYWGVSAVAWMIITVTVLSLAPAVAAMLVAYRDTRRDSRKKAASSDDEGGEYLSSFGLILSALFTLIIFVESLPVFGYLHGC